MKLIYTAISERPETTEDDRREPSAIKQIAIRARPAAWHRPLRRIEQRNAVDKERIESIREALLDRSDYTIGRLRVGSTTAVGSSSIASRIRAADGHRLHPAGRGQPLGQVSDASSASSVANAGPADE